MKISTRGRYGLRAMIDIASDKSGRAVPLREIAQNQGLSEKYLEYIMKLLSKAGLVRSVRGAKGGYMLNMPGTGITAGMILRALEGSISPTECADKGCEKGEECAAAYVWHELENAINAVVDGITLEELCDRAKNNKRGGTLDN